MKTPGPLNPGKFQGLVRGVKSGSLLNPEVLNHRCGVGLEVEDRRGAQGVRGISGIGEHVVVGATSDINTGEPVGLAITATGVRIRLALP